MDSISMIFIHFNIAVKVVHNWKFVFRLENTDLILHLLSVHNGLNAIVILFDEQNQSSK